MNYLNKIFMYKNKYLNFREVLPQEYIDRLNDAKNKIYN
jgi:hypothetical protein